MTDTLTFHIGDFKTGTTAIQNWVSQAPAKRLGLWSPLADCDALAHSLNDPTLAPLAFAELAQNLHGGKGHAVVSSEHFEAVNPFRLRDLIEAFLPRYCNHLTVLGYVRPHASSLVSRYAESLKIGSFSGSLDAYYEWKPTFWRLRSARRFSKWKDAFGSAFKLRLYDPTNFAGGDIRRDFAQSLTSIDPGPLGQDRQNRSVSVIDLAYLSALQSAIGPTVAGSIAERARWQIGRRIAQVIEQGHSLGGPSLGLHAALAERLWHGYRADAAELDALYFSDGDLVRILMQARDAAQHQHAPILEERDWLGPDARRAAQEWGQALGAKLQSEDTALEVLSDFSSPNFASPWDMQKYA